MFSSISLYENKHNIPIGRNSNDRERSYLRTPCSYSMLGQIQRGTGRGSGISITTIQPSNQSRPLKRYIAHFRKELEKGNGEYIEINNHYSCVKVGRESSYSCIFFSPELYRTQIKIKRISSEGKKRRGKNEGEGG